MLEEVVVQEMGIPTGSRIDVASNAVEIEFGKELGNIPTASPMERLQGRATGMRVSLPSGLSGAAPNVTIRGTGSISAGSEPLYIIDGIPVTTGNDGGGSIGAGTPGFRTSPLSTINPNDIESIEVLKDAASTAKYGARKQWRYCYQNQKRSPRANPL